MFKTSHLIISVLTFSLLSWVSAEKCSTYYTYDVCVGFNETCGPLSTTTSAYAYCNKGYYCDNDYSNSTNRCLRILEEGDACDSSDQCGPYSCYNNKCQDYSYAYIGEACQFDYQCATSDLICDQDKNECVLANPLCDSNYDCPVDKYCNSTTGACLNRLEIGGKCDDSDHCPYLSYCSKNNNGLYVCTRYFSKDEGDVCGSEDECDPDQNLVCSDYTGKCVSSDFNINKPTSSDYNCNATGNSCQSFEGCFCMNDLLKGTCILDYYYSTNETIIECNQSYKRFYSCLIDNGCQSTEASAKSCAFTKCAAEYCDLTDTCSVSKIPLIEGCGDYVASDLCTYLGASSSITIPLLSIIVIVSMLLL